MMRKNLKFLEGMTIFLRTSGLAFIRRQWLALILRAALYLPTNKGQTASSQKNCHAPQFLFLILVCFFNMAYAENLSDEAKRLQNLTQEIRCVVCQNQTIADSNAPLAQDLRKKIEKMMSEKKSNEEIKDYLVKRYGEYILLQPRFNKTTFLLWAFPFTAISLVIAFLLWLNIKQI